MKLVLILLLFLIINHTLLYSQTFAVKTDVKPIIDGILENIWDNASKFTSFKQMEPEILAEATIKTEGYFLYDEENIYVAMKMFQDKNTIRSSNGRKDAEIILDGDYMAFIVDPLNNYAQAFFFGVNAVNAVIDGHVDENGTAFIEWDGIFNSEVYISDNYWNVEIQVPLSTINFQDKMVQDWNVRFLRNYSQNQEVQVSRIEDINGPHRLTNYNKLFGLKGLYKEYQFRITPYIYSLYNDDFLTGTDYFKGKVGGEVRYSPSSSMTILSTVNPDYAQIETDREVINVSDLPTQYPEKRPFFIESSDFYPGAAVNTRNITNIKTGLKIRKLGDLLKYDVTGVLDGDNNQWLLSNIKLSKSNSYIAEVIGGIKNQKSRYDYNVTSHLQKWFLNRRFSFSNWIGTINSLDRGKNEWEVFTGAGWNTRNFGISFSNHIKSQFYNPNIVGWNYLSNLNKYSTSFRYSVINEVGFLRTIHFKSNPVYFDLVTPSSNSYWSLKVGFESILHLNDYMGNWSLNFFYYPTTTQNFRYRKVNDYEENRIYEDEVSRFVLIDDRLNSLYFELESDITKALGFSFSYNNNQVRKSKADQFSSEIYWKITPSSVIKYSFDFIKIYGSEYQSKLEQLINRLEVEYNITDKLNIRAIVQPNIYKLPHNDNYKSDIIAYNFTFSWEYMSGSFMYLVYNNYKNIEEKDFKYNSVLDNNQFLILKINKSLSF
jgi:hypothetical protein